MMLDIIMELQPDNEATALQIVEDYRRLSERYHDGESNNWFTFSYWAARQVGIFISGSDPKVSNALTGGMRAMYEHVTADPDAVIANLEGTVRREQELLQPWLVDAFATLDPVQITHDLMHVAFPNETLWARDRVPNTFVGSPIGAPVENWLRIHARTNWMLGVIRTHLHDMSLRVPHKETPYERAVATATVEARRLVASESGGLFIVPDAVVERITAGVCESFWRALSTTPKDAE